jgi:hypothetical protein
MSPLVQRIKAATGGYTLKAINTSTPLSSPDVIDKADAVLKVNPKLITALLSGALGAAGGAIEGAGYKNVLDLITGTRDKSPSTRIGALKGALLGGVTGATGSYVSNAISPQTENKPISNSNTLLPGAVGIGAVMVANKLKELGMLGKLS